MKLHFRAPDRSEGRLAPDNGVPIVAQTDSAACPADLAEWAKCHRKRLREKLCQHGAILFRGFGVDTAEEFDRVALAVEPKVATSHYFDDGIRRWLSEHTYEAFDNRATFSYPPLYIHNEDVYLPKNPSRIMWACLEAPERGGQTPIVDCRRVLADIPPAIRERFADRFLIQRRNFPYEVVVNNCGTDEHDHIEALCKRYDVREIEWSDAGDLTLTSRVPAIIRHPETGEAVWFNEAKVGSKPAMLYEKSIGGLLADGPMLKLRSLRHTAKLGASALLQSLSSDGAASRPSFSFEDEESIQISDQLQIVRAYWKNVAAITWRQGDMLVLDNRLVAHGRLPFVGARRIASCIDAPSAPDIYRS